MADEAGEVCEKCLAPPPSPPPSHPTAVTWILIAFTTLASAVSAMLSEPSEHFGSMFGPSVAGGDWWLLLTGTFVHLSPGHLFGNMLLLWLFGQKLEPILGRWTFLAAYLICGLAAGVTAFVSIPEIRTLGASGAVYGIAGGLISVYTIRFKSLTRLQWLVLLAFAG